jgi:hypothetical protein
MASGLTTELDTINTMLSAIGSAPVNTIDEASADASLAKNVLTEVTRQVLLEGWNFNTERDYELTPGVDGQITLPDTVLRVVYTRKSPNDIDPVQRGQRLYDKKNRTYTFSSPLRVEIVWMLPWNDLPEAARAYIKYRAARVFVDRALGSETLRAMAAQEEARALSDLRQYDGDTANYSIFDSWSVARILDRSGAF